MVRFLFVGYFFFTVAFVITRIQEQDVPLIYTFCEEIKCFS